MNPGSLQVRSSSSNLMVNQSEGDMRETAGPMQRCRVKGVSTGRRTGEIDFELLSVEPLQKMSGMMHDGCLLRWMSC